MIFLQIIVAEKPVSIRRKYALNGLLKDYTMVVFTAWCTKFTIFTSKKVSESAKKIKEKKVKKQNLEKHRIKILRRLHRLNQSSKNFLLDKKKNDIQKFETSGDTLSSLFNAGIINFISYDSNLPEQEIEIQDWVWEKLGPNLLYPVEDKPQKNPQ